VLLEIGAINDHLFLIRRGAVEAHDRHGNLVGRYGEGESFGLQSLLTGKPVRFRITLIEDGLVWTMPGDASTTCAEIVGVRHLLHSQPGGAPDRAPCSHAAAPARPCS
jgi:signal-transduction protein with cAMP-binding, CBS, and nucleotidyltransferase domain